MPDDDEDDDLPDEEDDLPDEDEEGVGGLDARGLAVDGAVGALVELLGAAVAGELVEVW